jgi:hypothetical protein
VEVEAGWQQKIAGRHFLTSRSEGPNGGGQGWPATKKAARVAGGFPDASEGFLQGERAPSSAVGFGNQK